MDKNITEQIIERSKESTPVLDQFADHNENVVDTYLYDLLHIPKTVTQDKINLAYTSVLDILDKESEKEKIEPYQQKTLDDKYFNYMVAHKVLSDKDHRSNYDKTGKIPEQFLDKNFRDNFNLKNTFKLVLLSKEVDPNDIVAVAKRLLERRYNNYISVLADYQSNKNRLKTIWDTYKLEEAVERSALRSLTNDGVCALNKNIEVLENYIQDTQRVLRLLDTNYQSVASSLSPYSFGEISH